MLVPLFIIYIKDFLKFLLVYNIAVIISFGYPTYNIATFLFVNICLARDLFRELEVDF
jgi:hypothetical protein